VANRRDYTGQTYGKLTALRRNGTERRGAALWLFLCECGNTKTLRATAVLKDNSISHCGCVARQPYKIHGATDTFEWRCWMAMRKRCNYEKHPRYKHYGGRGIKVCDRWQNSFENFLADMGAAPDNTHSIDRIDNNKGYSPDNCRWLPKKLQSANRRCCRGGPRA